MSDEELVKLIQQGIDVKSNMELLYMQKKGFIRYCTKKYQGIADMEDLMQEGYIGLADAVGTYDNTKYESFTTYLKYCLTRTFFQYLLKNNNKGKISRTHNEYICRYLKLQKYFNANLNREPAINEYVAYLGLSEEMVNKVRTLINERNIVSIDRSINEEEKKNTFVDTMLTNGENIENDIMSHMIENDLKTGLWEIVKSNTSEEEYEVIYAVYKLNMPINKYAIHKDITEKKVRCDLGRALGRLRTYRVKKMISSRYEINYAQAYKSGLNRFKNSFTSSTECVAIKNLENELDYISYVLTATIDGLNLLNSSQIKLALNNGLIDEDFKIHAKWEKIKPGKKPQEVEQYDLQGVFIKRWNSALEASVQLKIDESSIRKCCNGKKKSAKGFCWKLVAV